MPEDFKTGTKLDFYFDVFRGAMLYAETFKANPKFGAQLRRLCHDFEERFKPGTERGLPDSFYLNWFILDNRFGVDQRTVIERMMEEKDFHSMPEAVKSAVREFSDSYATCYQVEEIRKEDIIFEELVTARRWTVYRIGDTYEDEARPQDIWHARFVGHQEDAYCFGQPFVFGPQAKSDFIKIADMLIKNFKEYAIRARSNLLSPGTRLRPVLVSGRNISTEAFPARLTRQILSQKKSPPAPFLSTTDGEKMRFSLVTFKIIAEAGLRDKLSGMRALEPDARRNCWTWLKSAIAE